MSRAPYLLCACAALLCAWAVSACSAFRTSTETPVPHAHESAAAPGRLAQVEFGREARYARCVEPACPAVTPKTLAVRRAPLSQPPMVAASAALPASAAAVPLAATAAPAPRTLVLHFPSNSALLNETQRARLREALPDFKRTDRIVIAGRTDDLGSEALNQSLAFARALGIRDYLLTLAPDLPARIAIDAKGRCCYALPNDSESARAQNRRVEIAFVPNAGATR